MPRNLRVFLVCAGLFFFTMFWIAIKKDRESRLAKPGQKILREELQSGPNSPPIMVFYTDRRNPEYYLQYYDTNIDGRVDRVDYRRYSGKLLRTCFLTKSDEELERNTLELIWDVKKLRDSGAFVVYYWRKSADGETLDMQYRMVISEYKRLHPGLMLPEPTGR